MTVYVGRELARYSPDPARPSHIALCAPAASVPSASVRTTSSPARMRTVTVGLARELEPERRRVAGAVVVGGERGGERRRGSRRVRSTAILTPWRAMLPAASRRSTSKRYWPSAAAVEAAAGADLAVPRHRVGAGLARPPAVEPADDVAAGVQDADADVAGFGGAVGDGGRLSLAVTVRAEPPGRGGAGEPRRRRVDGDLRCSRRPALPPAGVAVSSAVYTPSGTSRAAGGAVPGDGGARAVAAPGRDGLPAGIPHREPPRRPWW